MTTNTKKLERRVAVLEQQVAVLRLHHGQFEDAVNAVSRLINAHSDLMVIAASKDDTVTRTRALQIVDRRGNVTIQLTTGADNEPLIHVVHRTESGEIRHVQENVLFPPATHKGVNDD